MKKVLTHLKKSDKVLASIIDNVGRRDLPAAQGFTPYRELIRAITYQQLHGKAAANIYRRFTELYPSKRFPRPEEILSTSLVKLKSAGLSEAKARAILDVAAKTISGVVPSSRVIRTLSDEEIIERLTAVRGVGEWTVQMLLIFQLGRLDVLPINDFGVRKGFSLAYKRPMPKPSELLAFGERWRPFRSIAAWYMWRAIDLARTGLINTYETSS